MSTDVHIEWTGETFLVGRIQSAERGPAVSFEYDRGWLGRADGFAIDPTSLPLRPGPFHSPALFGAMQDCGPDRWGRLLLERAVRKHVLDAKPYQDLDYVLALDDVTRIGALRFSHGGCGPFLSAREGRVPPLVRLSALLQASDAVHGESETAEDLRFLLGQGSPLGGARPKSVVTLPDGTLALAKFPKPDDTRDIAAGEILALTLAAGCGIRVPPHRLVRVGNRSVALIHRFDREAAGSRIPFISGRTLVALPDGQPGAYTMLADGIRQFGFDVAEELRELWRRLVFSLLASNFDDHLRNHGFLMRAPGQWALSPAYDLNPVPEIDRRNTLKTGITEDHDDNSVAAALAAAPRFGLKPLEARQILKEISTAVAGWRKTGRELGIRAATLDAYASAFEHPLADEARRILR